MQQAPNDESIDRHPDRPPPVGIAAKHAGIRLSRKVLDLIFLPFKIELRKDARDDISTKSESRKD